MTFRKKMHLGQQRFNESQKQSGNVLSSADFGIGDNIKSEYDMWSWIFQEIANLRVEVSRLGTLVRINNINSPNYLKTYHAHILSLLLPISTIVSVSLWEKIEALYNSVGNEVESYLNQRSNVPNKKIPNALINKLDSLYRAALLIAQKAGLGVKVQVMQDLENAIERAITISD